MKIIIKTAEEIAKMREAGMLAAEALDFITSYVKPGVATLELDRLCHDYMVNEQKVVPAPLHYAPSGYKPYPNSICTSVNNQVCHGIPSGYKLKNGDILNIDITVIKDGWHGDTSRMFLVGDRVSDVGKTLCDVTWQCLWLGISQVRPGNTVGDIGHAIQSHARQHGFSVVREYCGHGLGRSFHENPQIMHFGTPGSGVELRPGMVFTVEPMINVGRAAVTTLSDGWTVVTRDSSWSAQWEHTVAVTESGYEILTLSAGAPPAPVLAKHTS